MRLWWGPERGLARLHRAREILVSRSGDGTGAAWRCCGRWQRALNNKLSARAFAAAHGCRVPALYWTGRVPRLLPVGALPRDVVIKPAFGRASQGVHLLSGGRDLLGGGVYDPSSLRRHLVRSFGELSTIALIAEEFVRDESGRVRVPTEYKLFVFGDHVAAIEVSQRVGLDAHKNPRNAYTASWTPFEPRLRTADYLHADFEPPRCLDEMVEVALRLARVYGTFVRVDLYATERGCVFGELSSTPSQGTGFSAGADRVLGELWRERLGDRE